MKISSETIQAIRDVAAKYHVTLLTATAPRRRRAPAIPKSLGDHPVIIRDYIGQLKK